MDRASSKLPEFACTSFDWNRENTVFALYTVLCGLDFLSWVFHLLKTLDAVGAMAFGSRSLGRTCVLVVVR